MDSYDGSDYSLATLDRDGAVPECRMRNARHVVDMARRLWENDQKRSWQRSRTAGLVGGNPPFRNSKLRDANAEGRCNSNWGSSRSYMDSGSGSFYDLFTEAPGLLAIRTSFGLTADEIDFYSNTMSVEADRILKDDPVFDYTMQQSQWEMTLYGCGPLMFEDMFKVIPRSVHCGDLKVPERTRSDTEYFEVATIDVDWYPPELYAFIRKEESATRAGWNVRFTQEVISNAMDIRQPDQRTFDWEFYQQELKNSSLSYYDDSKVNRCCVAFWKEFSGRITQAIVEREPAGKGDEYMFLHVDRYENWRQCLHPMYYDRGHGGFHHSVTGLGVKMYGPMVYENRLLCNLYDKAQAPDILFKPTTTESTQKFQLAHMSQFGIVPAGFDVIQTPVKGFVQDGLAMFKTSSELMRSNLSSYRQAPPQQSGNPPTKFQKQLEAQQSSSLSNTSYNRYYQQLDMLYAEMVRRMCNLNSPEPKSKLFQERCINKGVPVECFGRIESVRAQRVVGQGSPFLRRDAIASLGELAGSLPEDGKNNWTNDFIASHCGQSAVERYNPRKAKHLSDDQDERVANQIADMKVGVMPPVTPSQNALRFAAAFLNACVQAIQSVKQGANPAEVVKFLDLCGPACLAHVKRVLNDPLREAAAKQILDQWEQMSKLADQLKKMIAQQQQKQQEQMQKAQQAQSDGSIKAQKVQGDLMLKAAKQKHAMELSDAKHKQELAIKDATAASEIHRKNRMATMQE